MHVYVAKAVAFAAAIRKKCPASLCWMKKRIVDKHAKEVAPVRAPDLNMTPASPEGNNHRDHESPPRDPLREDPEHMDLVSRVDSFVADCEQVSALSSPAPGPHLDSMNKSWSRLSSLKPFPQLPREAEADLNPPPES
mmetsp:Transcript_14865/g.21803  ORF Transcript_14865/g.21803 Transcript_14865/m.21803 type:complete len:138 (-) Transcript_14865:913-1326(-)